MIIQILFMMFMITLIDSSLTSDYSYPIPVHVAAIHHDNTNVNEYGRRRRLETMNKTMSPLYLGYGTHYSFLYVGTPPQRVSVIIDTGSHNTAFPCVGCHCGKHMDPFFDPKKSKSSSEVSCVGTGRCYVMQSYNEGSSWKAYKVKDKVVVAGKFQPSSLKNAVDFIFHCQGIHSLIL